MNTLPLADEHPYALVDPSLHDRDEDFLTFCTYQRADIGDGEDMVSESHVLLTSQLTLYRSWQDSPYRTLYRELPVHSDTAAAWGTVIGNGLDRGVWWEGCGPDTPCAEDEEPTATTYARHFSYAGHVGNLEFYGSIIYVAQRLPADVRLRAQGILRDFVMATLDSYERVG